MAMYYMIFGVVIIVVFAVTVFGSKLALKRAANMSPEEAAQKFQDFWGGYFELAPGDQLVGVWSGLEYQAPKSMGQAVGSAAGELALNVVGVSSYVPCVHVGLTAQGHVLISREYSEMGSRGSFKQIMALDGGARAIPAETAHPEGNLGKVPNNPFNVLVEPEFVQLRGANGQYYEAWLSPQGVALGQADFTSIFQRLG